METNFTPGPWTIEETTLEICRLLISTEEVNADEIKNASGTIAYVPTDYATEEQHANARLIATAPELYEELSGALYFLDLFLSGPPLQIPEKRVQRAFMSARKALDKARGETGADLEGRYQGGRVNL